ncbi:hypothetical protein Cni_G01733 [Canna indica]|uniref:Glycosyltransferase 61 catalytic domain-containing protein n=1 Tax=Canna indica TaxID=4628 RepID=A0AAQ3Q1B8_9LILI|nr:hypothetical protein Cni_G01733 [Canna indica]
MRQKLPQKLVLCACMACLLIPCFFLAVLKPKFASPSLQLSLTTNIKIQVVEEKKNATDRTGNEVVLMPIALALDDEQERSTKDSEMANMQPTSQEEKTSSDATLQEVEMSKSTTENEPNKHEINEIPSPKDEDFSKPTKEINLLSELLQVEEQKQEINSQDERKNSITCDFCEPRSDTCVMHGDVRVHGLSSSIISANAAQESSWKLRPYARKWESPVMRIIRELTLKETPKSIPIPQCQVNHSVPAVVFSTGGFLGNFFHDFTDVLIPLFATSHRFHGQVQFIVTNFNFGWIRKYESVLNKLSNYRIIDLDRDQRVHCFPEVHVGLLSHKELGMDPSKTPGGYSMADFREFLRSCFALKRKATRIGGIKKPRLLVINRKGSRSLANRREVVSLAKNTGFKVMVAGPEETKNVSRFARMVNSCDVLMGVHGAGLTNMVFLPSDAALVQVIPWGGLKYACRHDFGEPAADMGVKYWEYEIREEESSLIRQYPRNHPVFTDPMLIHKQGWDVLWSVFLNRQSVRLDVRRFRGVLQQVLQGLPH